MREIIEDERIDCEVEMLNGYLFAAYDVRKNLLEDEREAVHREGLVDVRLLEQSSLDSFNAGPCLRFPNQMKLHPLKSLRNVVEAFTRGGGNIDTHTQVVDVQGGGKGRGKNQRRLCSSLPF